MATLATAARTAACDAILTLIDAGNQAARLIITTVSGGTGTTLATITLNDPAFTIPSTAGVGTLIVSPALADSSADATGTAAGFALQSMNSGTPTTVISGSVATSAADITIDNTSITVTQVINLNSMTITVPAS